MWNSKSDVEVEMVDPADSRIVRHLAAVVLGPKAPSPLKPNALAQRIEWNGKDDYGNPVRNALEMVARLRVGMSVSLEQIVGGDPYAFYSGEMGDDKERFTLYADSFDVIRNIEIKKARFATEAKKHAPTLTDYYKSQVPSERIASHFEICAAALITGMTNVVSLHLDSLTVIYKELGIEKYLHALGHNDPGLSGNGWDGVRCRMEVEKSHFKHIAKMAKTLEAIPEGNGSMLDNTLIVYLSCSGGAHHDGQKDWPFVLVGGMAKKLKMGQYLEFSGYKEKGHRTIANLYLTFMHAAGMNAPKTFGQLDGSLRHLDLTGPLEELEVG